MRRATLTATLTAVLAGSLALSGSGLAADYPVPVFSGVKAHPKRFCAKRTSSCQHVGTRISFNVSKPARVRIDVIPRTAPPRHGYVEVVRHFGAGANSARIDDSRLTPGPWDVRLQGTGAQGSGPIAKIRVRVVKHDQ